MTRLATAVVLPKVVVAETLSVRVSRKGWPEGTLIPPLVFVTPVPLITPPVQVNCVVKFRIPVLVIVPALKFVVAVDRSEERRVGNETTSRWVVALPK